MCLPACDHLHREHVARTCATVTNNAQSTNNAKQDPASTYRTAYRDGRNFVWVCRIWVDNSLVTQELQSLFLQHKQNKA